jgi:outer membrane protein OmpA-like peptidoglycan-associated protein
MKKSKLVVSLLFGALSACGLGTIAHASTSGYNFSYSVSGDKKVIPFQVFDDGKETYFQFKTDDVPAIFAVQGSQRNIVNAKKSGMYVVVDGVSPEYIVQAGDSSATVRKSGVSEASIKAASKLGAVMNEEYSGAEDKKMAQFPNRVEFTPKTDWDRPVPVNQQFQKVEQSVQTFYVPFKKGSIKLGPDAKAKLSVISTVAKKAVKIEVKGGPDSSSDSQSIMRAIAIQDFLVAKGQQEDKVLISELPAVKAGGKKQFMSEVDIYINRNIANQWPAQPNYEAGAAPNQNVAVLNNAKAVNGGAFGLPANSYPAVNKVASNEPVTIQPAIISPVQSLPVVAIPPAVEKPKVVVPVNYALSIQDGDSLKSKVTEYAKTHGYNVNWSGEDLFATSSVTFSSANFEETLNKLFVASKISGVIANDEGGVVNVYVK